MANRDVALEPGTVLDARYVIERVLDPGDDFAGGVRISAEDRKLDRRVTLKLMPELADRPERAARFLREARAAMRLRNEHTVRVLEAGVLRSGTPFLSMEYTPGVDLSEHFRAAGTLPVEQVLDYVLQCLEALAEAHRAGLTHGNLEPANLLLTSPDDDSATIKVTGFMLTADDTLPSPYAAPEQMQKDGSADLRSDLWSIAAIAYQLLSGKRPFSGTTPESRLAAIERTEPEPLPPPAPRELSRILAKCLEPRPDDRFQSAAELARALSPLTSQLSARLSVERIVGTRSSLPPASVRGNVAPPAPERPSRGPESLRRRVIAAIVVAAALGVVAYALHQGRVPRREGPRSVFSRADTRRGENDLLVAGGKVIGAAAVHPAIELGTRAGYRAS